MIDKNPSLKKEPENLKTAKNIFQKYCEKSSLSEKQKAKISKKGALILDSFWNSYENSLKFFGNEEDLNLIFSEVFNFDQPETLANKNIINKLKNKLNEKLLSTNGYEKLAEEVFGNKEKVIGKLEKN